MNGSRAPSTTLAELIRPLISGEGFTPTSLSDVALFCLHEPMERSPLLYQPSLTIVAQGEKVGYLGDRVIEYHPGQYLVQTLPLPFECEISASREAPMMGLTVHIDPAVLSELVTSLAETTDPDSEPDPVPMDSVAMTQSMNAAVERLVKTLHDPAETRAMGPARIREVVFEAIRGAQGPALRALVVNRGSYSRIVHVLSWLQEHYNDSLAVDDLAGQANMSPSNFHQRFKEITHTSPVQYVKKLRLLKAQMLLSQNELNVNRTAHSVGYNSQAQFSRDYKRYFGVSPMKHLQLAQQSGAGQSSAAGA